MTTFDSVQIKASFRRVVSLCTSVSTLQYPQCPPVSNSGLLKQLGKTQASAPLASSDSRDESQTHISLISFLIITTPQWPMFKLMNGTVLLRDYIFHLERPLLTVY